MGCGENLVNSKSKRAVYTKSNISYVVHLNKK